MNDQNEALFQKLYAVKLEIQQKVIHVGIPLDEADYLAVKLLLAYSRDLSHVLEQEPELQPKDLTQIIFTDLSKQDDLLSDYPN